MKYEIWQVRDKNTGSGSKIWLYAVRHDCDILNFIDSDIQSLYNRKGEWNIDGYGDFPKFFRVDYREGSENENY